MLETGRVPPFGLRLPEPLKTQVKESADRNRRSMNSEIVVLLERAVQQQTPETQNSPVTA